MFPEPSANLFTSESTFLPDVGQCSVVPDTCAGGIHKTQFPFLPVCCHLLSKGFFDRLAYFCPGWSQAILLPQALKC